jgi:hypothetical protein
MVAAEGLKKRRPRTACDPIEHISSIVEKGPNYKCTGDIINKGSGRRLAAKMEDGPRTALEEATRKWLTRPRPKVRPRTCGGSVPGCAP